MAESQLICFRQCHRQIAPERVASLECEIPYGVMFDTRASRRFLQAFKLNQFDFGGVFSGRR